MTTGRYYTPSAVVDAVCGSGGFLLGETMSETKRFPLRTVLSVTTGRLLTKMGDLYEILGWLTNDTPFTHQLPRFERECSPWLMRWFPELERAGFKVYILDEFLKTLTPELAVDSWLGGFAGIMPDHYDVPRIPAGEHVPRDPIGELIEMRGTDDGVVVVTTD